MSFDWAYYIRLAESLEREAGRLADRESCLRSAISRAYYGAFGLAREMAVTRDGLRLTQSPQDHQNVINHFRRSSRRTRRQIGLELDRLRRARNQADYEDQLPRLDQVVLVSLQRARQVEQNLTRTLMSIFMGTRRRLERDWHHEYNLLPEVDRTERTGRRAP